MTDPAAGGRREAWTAQPEEPLKYRWRDRLRDRRAGRVDGRTRVPTLRPDAERGSLSTPYLWGMRNRCGELLAREMSGHRAAVNEIRQELVDAEERRERLSLELQQLNQQLKEASLPLSEEQMNRRGRAERDPVEWPDDLVRARQERRHRAARARLEDQQRAVASDLDRAQRVADELRVTIEDERRVLRSRGWRIVHFHRRREATYLRALGRSHPDGPAVVALLEPDDPYLPDWLDTARPGEDRESANPRQEGER